MPPFANDFALGVTGFTYADLYAPARLRDLAQAFYDALAAHDAALHTRLQTYLDAQGVGYTQKDESALLIAAALYLSEFVAQLFGVTNERAALITRIQAQDPLWTFKTFLTRRAIKAFPANVAQTLPLEQLDAAFSALCRTAWPDATAKYDAELSAAYAVTQLLEAEKIVKPHVVATPQMSDALACTVLAVETLRQAAPTNGLTALNLFPADFYNVTATYGEAASVAVALRLAEAWAAAHFFQPVAHERVKDWVSFKMPRPLDPQHLVHITRTRPDLPEWMESPPSVLRRRDGFTLTDTRGTPRQRLYEADYCLYCHERAKDSCSKGFHEKDGAVKRNSLNVKLAGCPLDEKISEMHVLKKSGDSLAALALVMIDNPMCPGTGHRVCNDCMTSCIFQKQEPVNIPFSETGILTDVLELPYGVEIYGLLTRWNPLNARQPHAKEYNGKNVLIVGLGPAGYTLAHYLLNEGFGVAGVDGLKIEPLPSELVGDAQSLPQPVKDFASFCTRLDERILRGFGGVSEYGITVRWDKNFLKLIYLTLARRSRLRVYGGVRFGGTLTIDDAWRMGFDHIALATGAGRPTLVKMKNGLARGVRQASDFLMALQLGGAFRRDLLANLQMRLPALIIGGGLTAFDNATEAAAYYPVQVENFLMRHEQLASQLATRPDAEAALWASLNAEETQIYQEFMAHGQAVRAERARAQAIGEEPDFVSLVQSWGGVTLVYRKRLQDAPAYRLNHEEVEKALEEGVAFLENMTPQEVVTDEHGAAKALICERMRFDDASGRWRGTGENVTLPARAIYVAAGTSPNTVYAKEYAGLFEFDVDGYYFQPHHATRRVDGRFALEKAPQGAPAFFTSYAQDGHFISFYGDNHPSYAGNVVKAMASAKHSYPQIAALFADAAPVAEEVFEAQAALWDDALTARVESVQKLTANNLAVTVRAPQAARNFRAGQFFRLQNYETTAPQAHGVKLMMEGTALAGISADAVRGTVRLMISGNGTSSRLAAQLKAGEQVALMGPTGGAFAVPENERVLLIGGGYGNALLEPLARELRGRGNRILWCATHAGASATDIVKLSDSVIWASSNGDAPPSLRESDRHGRDSVTEAVAQHAAALGWADVQRIVVAGSAALLAEVKAARATVWTGLLAPQHLCLASLNNPMQCMMKEVCASCLQSCTDPQTGRTTTIYACYDQHQPLDLVDVDVLQGRLAANGVLEKQAAQWLAVMAS